MNADRELQRLRITSLIALVMGIAAVLLSALSYNSHQQLREAEDNRYQAYKLTEQLRLSSDSLTMMARAYAATGEPRFKDYFQQIVAIRDGLAPRPENYHRVYWDLLLVGFQPSALGEARALDELMVAAGISEQELALLRLAKAESDALTAMENRAFNAVEGRFLDDEGHYSTTAPPDRALAQRLLHSPEYFLAKARIMSYINSFYEKMEARTAQIVDQLDSRNRLLTALALSAFIALIALLIYHSRVRNRLQRAWLEQLQQEIERKTADLSRRNAEYRDTIAELKETREQLVESEKFSALGSLVASVAHEINTPLGVAITASTHAQAEIEKLSEDYQHEQLSRKSFQRYLDGIENGLRLVFSNLNRVSELVSSFKQVSVDQSLEEKRRINLADYVNNVLVTIQPKFKQSPVTVVADIPADIELMIEPGALAQILTNLIINAYLHAFAEGQAGEISIAALRQDGSLLLSVSDNGLGMPPEVQEKIYQPFFTTRRNRGGTGLGMNIVYNLVVQRLGGKIHCLSEPGRGSRFTLTLPLESSPPQRTDNVVPFG